jgi:hypothetical protein
MSIEIEIKNNFNFLWKSEIKKKNKLTKWPKLNKKIEDQIWNKKYKKIDWRVKFKRKINLIKKIQK